MKLKSLLGMICTVLLTVHLSFGQSSDASLTTQANVIRNETSPGGNTRGRIADMYQAIIDSKLSKVNNLINDNTFATSSTTTVPTSESVKQYVLQKIIDNTNSINWKSSVKTATTANITLSGSQTIDGVSCSSPDRVLVKDQSTPSQNGIYVVSAGSWTRATDMDQTAEFQSAVVNVDQGTINAASSWRQVTDNVVVGSSSVSFVGFVSSAIYIATTSGTNAYTASTNPAINAYATWQIFLVKVSIANTSSATINFNSLGAKSLVKNGSTALASGDLVAGKIYMLVYDGTNMQIIDDIYTASNGLTISSNDIKLGGTLSATTTIAAGSNPLAITAGVTNGLSLVNTFTQSANSQSMRSTTGTITGIASSFQFFGDRLAPVFNLADVGSQSWYGLDVFPTFNAASVNNTNKNTTSLISARFGGANGTVNIHGTGQIIIASSVATNYPTNHHALEFSGTINSSTNAGIYRVSTTLQSNSAANNLYVSNIQPTFNVGSGTDATVYGTYYNPTLSGTGTLNAHYAAVYGSGLFGINTLTPTSFLHVNGSVAAKVSSVSATTTLDNTYYLVLVDATGGARTINLPSASGCSGRIYIIKKIDASGNAVTIDPNSTETVDGAATYALSAQWKYAAIQCDGANWVITANN